ncbi:MAG: lipopolysaccharide biosynthesis protein [Gammaproteobacteria bacterium]|nr:lipopolysaccharide biosynthesis protein [Gammaproteobacteria bacterium]
MITKATGERAAAHSTRRNFGYLLAGRIVAALTNFAVLAILARELGSAALGILVLLHSYSIVLKELVSFKPEEAVVKFGVACVDSGDHHRLKQLLRRCLRLDVIAASISSFAVIALAGPAGHIAGWQSQHFDIALVFGGVLLLSGTGTGKGVLRLNGHYAELGLATALGPLLRLLATALVVIHGGGLFNFALAWAAGMAIEYLLINGFAWRSYRRTQPRSVASEDVEQRSQEFTGLRRFLWVTYWQSSLDLLPSHLPVLMIGGMLGSTDAGLFRIAWEIAQLLAKPAMLLRSAVLPDLARLWRDADPAFIRLCLKSAALVSAPAVALALVVQFAGAPLVDLILGQGYEAMVPLLALLAMAAAVEVASATLRPAGYVSNTSDAMLWIQVGATVVYFVAFIFLTRLTGLSGPGWAALLSRSLEGLLALWVMVIAWLNHRRRPC